MNSNRVYRKKLTREYIIGEIEKNKGRQFDPEIADVMLRLLRENRLPVEA
jgi:HD-GYP domain-containing protein (c-di-GMP phosphodiesterase class II)